MSSGEVAPITVEEANKVQQSAPAAAAAEEEGEESDSAIGDNYADDDLRDDASVKSRKIILRSSSKTRTFCLCLI